MILLSPININSRIIFIATALAVPYLMFTVSYEGIFYFVFVTNIIIWLQIEQLDEKYENIENSPFDLGPHRDALTLDLIEALWRLPVSLY